MKLTEYQAKTLLAERGVPTPSGRLATTVEEVRTVAADLGGRVAVKAQVASGGRGKAGGIAVVDSAGEAAEAAGRLLGMTLADEVVTTLLVESAVEIAAERYLSVTIDPSTGRPMIMRSEQGGIEIESMTESIERQVLGPDDRPDDPLTATLVDAFFGLDALLIEINPLAVTADGRHIALDAKIELDDAARFRHEELFARVERPETAGTEREREAAALGLRLIELGGDIAVLANGAGLTMATMDAIVNAGGAPANFCGAFARCDVMTAGVVEAWEALRPDLPVNFSISGTGQDEATAMVRDRLGMEPHPSMADAVAAAVAVIR